jgi:hypothetical protein
MRRYFPQEDPQQAQQARLIKHLNRKYELVDGSTADRAAAADWISMFMKNDVVHGAHQKH